MAELREAVVRLLDATEKRFGPVLHLDADHYWTIEARDSFDLTKEPPILAGQISDDVATIRQLLAQDDDEIFLWHDLYHLIGVLSRISALDLPQVREPQLRECRLA